MIVAEMLAVSQKPPAKPYSSPWGWRPPSCTFLEDCPSGCDDARGETRPLDIPHPCTPDTFSDCHRVSRKHVPEQVIVVDGTGWGEPKTENITICTRRGNGYKRLPSHHKNDKKSHR